jgi:hypothetical protein
MECVDTEISACGTSSIDENNKRTIDDYFPALQSQACEDLETVFSERITDSEREIVHKGGKCSTCSYDFGAKRYWLVNRPEKEGSDAKLTDFVFEYALGDAGTGIAAYYVALVEKERNRSYSFVVVVADRDKGAVYHYVDDHDVDHNPEEFDKSYIVTRCHFLKDFVHDIFGRLKERFGDCEEEYLFKRFKWEESEKVGSDIGIETAIHEFKKLLQTKKIHPCCCKKHAEYFS